MAASRRLPAMDIHHINEEHEVQYRLSKDRYPTEESNDEFELFTCPYDSLHKINSKTWRSHLIKCAKNYGGNIKICTFNASHRVPEPELEWHNMTCSDRHIIASHYETRDWRMATQVNHQPDWIEPEGESWDDEADSTAPTFRLNYDKAMPIQLLQHQPEYEEEFNNYVEDSEEENEEASEKDVLSEILIPEKPENWNDMSKSQKKNYKRKYDRQQQRMKEQGVTDEDFLRKPHVSLLTDSQINNRLNAIKALFPMNNHKEHAERVDYTSLLNIVCQKIRLNQPVYELTSAPHGGFMFKCRVHLDWYYGRDFCANKKDAKHNAAKWALLSMTIPGIDTEPPAPRAKPIPPSLRNNKDLREGDEVAKLSVAGMYPNQQVMPLRPPNKLPSNNITKLETPKEPVSANMSNQTSSSSNGQAWGQQTSVKMPKSSASQPMKQPEVNSNPARQSASQQPARPPATQSAWGQHANKNGHSSGPQGAWGQPANTTRQLQAGQPRSGQPNLLNGLQNLNLKDAGDFPALGGTAKNTSNPKKGMARGRGRGTVMKL